MVSSIKILIMRIEDRWIVCFEHSLMHHLASPIIHLICPKNFA